MVCNNCKPYAIAKQAEIEQIVKDSMKRKVQ